jgi:hypothetical protein
LACRTPDADADERQPGTAASVLVTVANKQGDGLLVAGRLFE